MHLIQLLLPARLESGESSTAVRQTREELIQQFGGITAYLRSPASGAWMSPGGEIEVDAVVMVEVVAEAFDRAWWRHYAERLKMRFGQQQMHVRATLVEMLD